MNDKWRKALMMQTIFAMKVSIANDIQIGLVPPTVKCFSDLHDYMDANEYGGFCVDEYADLLIELFGGRDEHEGIPQAYLDFINEAQETIDQWMTAEPLPEAPRIVLAH